MKNIIVFILALLISVNLSAQTKQPGQKKLNYFGSNIYLDQHQDFKQSDFVFGWHWYKSYKISQVLGVNMIHVNSEDPYHTPRYFDPDAGRYADSSKMIINAPYISHHWAYNGWSVSHSIGFLYEPTYKVDLTDPAGTFVPRKYDTTRYAFGFATVKGFIDTTSGSTNYNRLQLFNNDSIRGQVVLAEPYISDGMTTTIQTASGSIIRDTIVNIYRKSSPPFTRVDSLAEVEWKGVNFYFSINLRRLTLGDNAMNSDPILEIKLPFVTGGTTPLRGYIKFDGTNPNGNHRLKEHNLEVKIDQIDQLKLKVTYMGNCEIAINWIKFETPNTRKLLNGYYDNLIEDGIQDDMTKLTTPGFTYTSYHRSK